MHFRSACCIYFTVAWLLLFAVLGVGLSIGAGNAAGWSVAPISMLFVLLVTFSGCGLPHENAAAPAGPATLADPLSTPGVISPAPLLVTPAPVHLAKTRLYWLDNAKVVLITMVVVGHSATGFMGSGAFLGFASTQPTWFEPVGLAGLSLLKPLVVPLFFFISGFFSVASCTRKGRKPFLRASFLRLGPAYFLFWLVINPLNSYFAYVLCQPTAATFHYFPGSAATWFLSWLLVFQCGLALIDEVPALELPGFGRLFIVALAVAVVQLAASLVCAVGGSSLGFGEMPMLGPGGDGFFTALTFTGGVFAKANHWLVHPLPQSLVRCSAGYALFTVALVLSFSFLTLAPGAPGVSLPGSHAWTAAFFALQLPLGPYCVCICVLAIDLFQQRANFETPLTKFLAEGALAVYLLQYWAVTGFTYAFIVLLDSTEGVHIKFVNSTQSASSVDGGSLFLGFAFVAVLSVPTCFLVGGLLKKMPMLGRYL